MAQRIRHRGYTFTSFDIDVDIFEGLKKSFDKRIKYLVVGKETCPTTKRVHWQGYISFHNPVEFSSFVKKGSKWHIENAKGSEYDNKKYCSKEGDWREHGVCPMSGKRNDLIDLKKKILENTNGTDDQIILDDCENYQQIKFAEKIIEYKNKLTKRDWKPEVIWLYGESGSGKTRYAKEKILTDENKRWTSAGTCGSFYWNQYEGEEDVLMDDFRDSHMSITSLLRVLDWGECRVDVKGSSRQLLAKRIVVTSVEHPREFYASCRNEPIKQLLRRIDKIIHFDAMGHGTEVGGNTIAPPVSPAAPLDAFGAVDCEVKM